MLVINIASRAFLNNLIFEKVEKAAVKVKNEK